MVLKFARIFLAMAAFLAVVGSITVGSTTSTSAATSAASRSAAPLQPSVVEERGLTDFESNKLPSVATGNGRVYVSWGLSAPSSAQLAQRGEEETGNFNYMTLGAIGSSSSYFNTGVTTGSDGAVHYAWIQDGNTIRYRNQPVGQNWSGDRVAWSGGGFANSLSIAVQGTSEVFIAWRLGDGTLMFAYSNNSGGNWRSGAVPTPVAVYKGKPGLAAGASGPVIMSWTGTDGHIYVGQWNGNNFPNSRITGGGDKYFYPTSAVGPNGQAFTAFWGVSSGVLYATRQQNGSWSISTVSPQTGIDGPVAIKVDSLSNVHVAWTTKEGGARTFYAVRAPAENFSEPLVVAGDGSYKANVDMAVSVKNGYTLAHIAWESFSGSNSAIRYARVKTAAGAPVAPPTPTVTQCPTPPPAGNVTVYPNKVHLPLVINTRPGC